MIEAMNEAIGRTLSVVVQQLGPMQEPHAELVRRVLKSHNGPAKMALGCYMDECREKGNYKAMDRAVIDMSEVQ